MGQWSVWTPETRDSAMTPKDFTFGRLANLINFISLNDLVFRSQDAQVPVGYPFPIRDLLLGLNSAPSFFPPYNDFYADGGIMANNPTIELLSEYAKFCEYNKVRLFPIEIF